MKELFKNQYKNFILVFSYIFVGTLVYVVSADCLWDLWYLDLITGLIVVAIGCFIGYKYIKGEEANRIKKLEEAKNLEEKDNSNTSNIVEEKTEVEENK